MLFGNRSYYLSKEAFIEVIIANAAKERKSIRKKSIPKIRPLQLVCFNL